MPKPNPKSETLYVFSTQIVLESKKFKRILTNDNFTVKKRKKKSNFSTTADIGILISKKKSKYFPFFI